MSNYNALDDASELENLTKLCRRSQEFHTVKGKRGNTIDPLNMSEHVSLTKLSNDATQLFSFLRCIFSLFSQKTKVIP